MNYNQFHTAVKLELDKSEGLELPAFESEELDFWINATIVKFVKTRYSGLNVKGESVEETQKRTEDLRTLVKEVTITCTDPADPTLRKPNTRLAALPDDYWIALGEDVTITLSDSSTVRSGVHQINSYEYAHQIDDPFSPHILHYDEASPLRLFNNGNVELIGDGNYTITSYHLRYLKVPLFVTATVYATDSTASGDIEPGVTYEVEGTGAITYNGGQVSTGSTFVGVNGVKTFTTASGSPTVKRSLSNTDLPEFVHGEIAKMTANTLLENIEQSRYQTHTIEVGTME